MRTRSIRLRLAVLLALLVAPLLPARLHAAAPAPAPLASFPTPQAGVEALVAALNARDGGVQLKALFGQAGMNTVVSGDAVSDEADRTQFLAAYAAKHAIDTKDSIATLSIGADDWPFPIPLAKGANGWSFDVAAGEEEILNRRIGANELYTQQALLAYGDAQTDYARSYHDGRKLHVYAERFFSTPGKQDGLYWETGEGQKPSPLGPLLADAAAAGYHPVDQPTAPYHGYYYKILTRQGPNAPGGAYDYKVNGMLLGGYAAIAWPANWGHTGIMTFMISTDGNIYQKSLGPDTAKVAKAISVFDPDASWTKVGAPAAIPGEEAD